MATYAIGDIQGCDAALQKLLMHIHFDSANDILWFTGDLVNRGPDSLQVLRFIKNLGDKHITVLGNHDLHLLAVAYGVRTKHRQDTLDDILNAKDRDELIQWLRFRPIIHVDSSLPFVMVHAGLAPQWSLQKACSLAREIEMALRSDTVDVFLKNMYGNKPDQWNDQLIGLDRMRCIVNYFTRMRFCYHDGRYDLTYKGNIADKPQELIPWFDVANRANANKKIIFGHWAALAGITQTPNVYPLDTGCIWGRALTALRLEDKKIFSVSCG